MQSGLNRLASNSRYAVWGYALRGAGVTRLLCRRGDALRWGLGIRGIGATRPLCGIQRGGNRKSQGALARLCEFPGISPPKSPKNPITPIETSRDTLHPGTEATTRTNRPAGRVRGLGLRGERINAAFSESGIASLPDSCLWNRFAMRGRGYVGLPPKPAWGPVPRPHLRFAAVLSCKHKNPPSARKQ